MKRKRINKRLPFALETVNYYCAVGTLRISFGLLYADPKLWTQRKSQITVPNVFRVRDLALKVESRSVEFSLATHNITQSYVTPRSRKLRGIGFFLLVF